MVERCLQLKAAGRRSASAAAVGAQKEDRVDLLLPHSAVWVAGKGRRK